MPAVLYEWVRRQNLTTGFFFVIQVSKILEAVQSSNNKIYPLHANLQSFFTNYILWLCETSVC